MRWFMIGVCVNWLALILAGCGKPTPAHENPSSDHPLGIVSATRDGAMVVLTVVLKDQLKLQLCENDATGPTCWIEADTPTPIPIQLQDGNLRIGFAREKWDTSGVKLKTSFAELPAGSREVTIGTREKDGKSVSILVKLIPTTDEERRAIGKGEQVSAGDSATRVAPEK